MTRIYSWALAASYIHPPYIYHRLSGDQGDQEGVLDRTTPHDPYKGKCHWQELFSQCTPNPDYAKRVPQDGRWKGATTRRGRLTKKGGRLAKKGHFRSSRPRSSLNKASHRLDRRSVRGFVEFMGTISGVTDTDRICCAVYILGLV